MQAATKQGSAPSPARPHQQAGRLQQGQPLAGQLQRCGQQQGARSFVQGRAVFSGETKQGEGAGVEEALPPPPVSATGAATSSEAMTVRCGRLRYLLESGDCRPRVLSWTVMTNGVWLICLCRGQPSLRQCDWCGRCLAPGLLRRQCRSVSYGSCRLVFSVFSSRSPWRVCIVSRWRTAIW